MHKALKRMVEPFTAWTARSSTFSIPVSLTVRLDQLAQSI